MTLYKKQWKGHSGQVEIHKMEIEKGEMSSKACRKHKHKLKGLDFFFLLIFCF